MDFILHQWNLLQELGKSNPMVAGAISLWGLGVITFLCRNIPTNIFMLIKRECTTSLSFDNSQIGTNSETFANFLIWFEKNKWARWTRTLALNGRYYSEAKGETGTVAGIGNGTHFFVYKNRLFFLTRSQMTGSGAFNNVMYSINIVGLTRDRNIILSMINEFVYDPPNDKLGIYKYDKDWDRVADINHRHLDTVIIDSSIKNKIIKDIEIFKKSRQWYIDRGLSYKLVFVLHGAPGSGKSSFIKALASYFKAGIGLLSFQDIKDNNLDRALSTSSSNNFVLIEDFDSTKSTKSRIKEGRVGSKNLSDTRNTDTPVIEVSDRTLTLSGILNALDGVVSLDGTIIFMTTNVLNDIDPAILRAGRVDHIYELGKLRDKEVREYVELMFPNEFRSTTIVFSDIMGCDLQKLYLEHRDNCQDFVKSIPKKLKSIHLES
jgi:chaperone BCS1